MSLTSPGSVAFHHALAKSLAHVRISGATSQGTLAAELGIDQATVSRVESGQRRLTAGETFAWLEALGMNAGEAAKLQADLWREFGTRPPGFWRDALND
ncbi:helix-turn-helix domain-containing protein [Micrococcus terreus]|uniref:helix-turn-helix domain-containing protein n=1 Tax=Micrococcus terreus TaxID=574650 RepID=UPI0035CCDEA3